MPRTQSTKLSPYMPVELQPLLTPGGQQTGRQVVVLDPEGEKFQAVVVSDDYKLIPNSDVVQIAQEIIQATNLEFSEHDTLFNGKQFRQRFLIPDLSEEVRVGDVVAVALDIRNSYNCTFTVSIAFNMLRLKCENGLIISHLLGGLFLKDIGYKNFTEEMHRVSERIVTRDELKGAIAIRDQFKQQFADVEEVDYSDPGDKAEEDK